MKCSLLCWVPLNSTLAPAVSGVTWNLLIPAPLLTPPPSGDSSRKMPVPFMLHLKNVVNAALRFLRPRSSSCPPGCLEKTKRNDLYACEIKGQFEYPHPSSTPIPRPPPPGLRFAFFKVGDGDHEGLPSVRQLRQGGAK